MDNITRLKMLEKPTRIVDAVIDTDAYNEVDDQFAIAYMLKSTERINTKAIYAAPFLNNKSESPADGMRKSYDEIMKLLGLMNRNDVPVFKGSENYLPDEKTPVISDAANHLAKLAMNYSSDNPLYVIAIGAITNVASAILINPEIIDKIVIIWLGGHAIFWQDTCEFNFSQDIAAARIIFGCGAAFVHDPAMGSASGFTISEPELKYWLYDKTPISDYLARNVVNDMKYCEGKPWSRIIWDVTAVGWLTGDFHNEEIISSPIPEYDNHFSFDTRRHLMKELFGVNRDALLEDMINKLTK